MWWPDRPKWSRVDKIYPRLNLLIVRTFSTARVAVALQKTDGPFFCIITYFCIRPVPQFLNPRFIISRAVSESYLVVCPRAPSVIVRSRMVYWDGQASYYFPSCVPCAHVM